MKTTLEGREDLAQFFRSREIVGLAIGLVTVALTFSPYPVFYTGLVILSALIGYEISKAIGFKLFYVAPATFFLASVSTELGLLCALILTLYAGWKDWSLESFLKALIVSVYAGLLPPFLLFLKEAGSQHLIKLLLFVWAVDIFSYYVGKNFGRRPLAPRLSPKKTWEGLLGGMLAGSAVLSVFHGYRGLLMALPLTVVALLGDLFKSFIKRQVGIKDFSNVLGEHGGFTDRFDSLLFTAPLYLFLLKF